MVILELIHADTRPTAGRGNPAFGRVVFIRYKTDAGHTKPGASPRVRSHSAVPTSRPSGTRLGSTQGFRILRAARSVRGSRVWGMARLRVGAWVTGRRGPDHDGESR